MESARAMLDKAMANARKMRLLNNVLIAKRQTVLDKHRQETKRELRDQVEILKKIVGLASSFAFAALNFHIFRVGEYKPGRRASRFLVAMNLLWERQLAPSIVRVNKSLGVVCMAAFRLLNRAQELGVRKSERATIHALFVRCGNTNVWVDELKAVIGVDLATLKEREERRLKIMERKARQKSAAALPDGSVFWN